MVYHSHSLPWSIPSEDEQRFKKILTTTLGVFLIAAIAMPFLPSIKKQVEKKHELPPPVARLIYEKPAQPVQTADEPQPIINTELAPAPKPKPKPKRVKPEPAKIVKAVPKKVRKKPKPPVTPKKIAPVKPVAKKQANVNTAAQARKKAASVGLFSRNSSLADIRNNAATRSLKTRKSLQESSSNQTTALSEPTETFENTGSQGIEIENLDTALSSTNLSQRKQTKVKHKLASKTTSSKKSTGSRSGNRSDITTTFDKNKRILNNIYNRALRKDPGLQGKFVIRLTISSEGTVTNIQLISSELNNPALEKKLLSRIKMYKFKALNVGSTSQNFSIDFFPG
ncbi:MAG: AgmX/PglI C-terminal domain-containing protein [Gammaproteobacteria bacterium]